MATAIQSLAEPSVKAKPRIISPTSRVRGDRKSTRLNSSHANISYAVFCLKKKRGRLSLSTYAPAWPMWFHHDLKSTRLNSSHAHISSALLSLKKQPTTLTQTHATPFSHLT